MTASPIGVSLLVPQRLKRDCLIGTHELAHLTAEVAPVGVEAQPRSKKPGKPSSIPAGSMMRFGQDSTQLVAPDASLEECLLINDSGRTKKRGQDACGLAGAPAPVDPPRSRQRGQRIHP